MVSRRRVLASASSLSVLGGCVASRPPKARIGSIAVANHSNSEAEVEVVVETDDSEVLRDSMTVPPAAESDQVVFREDVSADPDRLTIRTSVAGKRIENSTNHTANKCLDALVKYWPSELSHWTKSVDGGCGSEA